MESGLAEDMPAREIKQKAATGILEWFRINDHEHAERAVELLSSLGIRHLRTGISWADYHTMDGEKWFDWLLPLLSRHFILLPCFHYTPPSLGIVGKTSSPPRNPKDYADFIDVFINRHGEHFEYVELWNEPNNRSEYDFFLDRSWTIFGEMIRMASYWIRQLGKKTVLGGMSPIDPEWLEMMAGRNLLEYIDVVGIHGFPGIFDHHWKGWETHIKAVKDVLGRYGLKKDIWITETGYSTWRFDETRQVEMFLEALAAPADRIYWYGLTDLPYTTPTVDGVYIDQREYHFGMVTQTGVKKLLYRLLEDSKDDNFQVYKWIFIPSARKTSPNKGILITGGAGFIGTNLANRLLSEGEQVIIYDNLSRPGAENNLQWLVSKYPGNITVMTEDIRNASSLEKALKEVSHVFHLAAQVAVTSSLNDPVYDFDVNIKGTLNILEAVRKSDHKPSLLFSSTNKVYGNLADIPVGNNTTRYYTDDGYTGLTGISEERRLDFYTPYGNSKGAADQYVLDYSRSFGLRNVVFRMSCIYGPHQLGTEDQGWVAHFILQALKKSHIVLYGSGLQVRDILYADDLVDAFLAARQNMNVLAGEVFNIGGGPANTISLLELINILGSFRDDPVPVKFCDWRKGDQKYYVSDISKFKRFTGWEPKISSHSGIRMLYNWFCNGTGKQWTDFPNLAVPAGKQNPL